MLKIYVWGFLWIISRNDTISNLTDFYGASWVIV